MKGLSTLNTQSDSPALSPVLDDLPNTMGASTPYIHAQLDPGASQNVIDRYKGWTSQAIKNDLDTNRGEMVNVFQNLANDFNKATALRTHNSMAGKLCIFTGRRKVDRRGMVGQHHYTHATFIESTIDAIRMLKADGYRVYAVDNSEWMNPSPIQDAVFPEKSAFIYGEEGLGLSEDIVAECDESIYIVTGGSVRSLNVATASAMVMFAYSLQHPFAAS